MKKITTLLLFATAMLFSVNSFAQCTTAAATYTNLNGAGGAPCDDGSGCVITDPDFTTSGFGIYASEAYLLDNVQTGYDYIFDMCTGVGAGAWIPAISIVAPSGAVDAFNLGTTGTFATNCSLAWTATESGTYTIVIHESGVACNTGNTIDNGNPTVTCGANSAPCTPPPPCVAGGLSIAGFPLSICPSDSFTLTSDGLESAAGGLGISFSPQATGAGGLGAFTLTGVTYPYTGDNDLNGVLSSNGYTVLTGEYAMYLVSYSDASDAINTICGTSTDSVMVTFLVPGDPGCAPAAPCIAGGLVSSPTMTICSNEIDSIVLDSTESTPGSYLISFDDTPGGTGGQAGGFSITNITSFPWVLDNDLQGTLSFNSLPVLNGLWDVTVYNVDASGLICDSVATTISMNFLDSLDVLCSPVTCAISAISAGAQTACDNLNNEYTQEITVTYADEPTTGMLDVNGQTFAITTSPQTVTLVGLNSDGLAVDVTASFTADTACNMMSSALFTSPTSCLCPTITVSVATTDVTNCASPDGTATATAAGGSGGYTYAWTPSIFGSGATISNLPAGSYSVIATDANGCSGTGSNTVNNSSGFSTALNSSANVTCFGLSNGEIYITPVGGTAPYTYTWSDAPTVPTFQAFRTNLMAGSYTIVVVDAGGCSSTLGPIVITEPNQLVATVDNSTDVSCFGLSDGSINVTTTGGNGGNTYAWSNGGGSNEDASSLSGGNYQLTVTDNNSCAATSSVISINNPPLLNISVDSQNDVSCNGANDGNILTTVTGGTGALIYDWDNAPNNEDVLNTGGGSYQLTVTDANACSLQSGIITIAEPNAIAISIDNSTDISCAGANDGLINASVTGGTGTLNILWTNGAGTTLTPNTLSANSYQLTVTDANMCSVSSSVVTITEPAALTATISATNTSATSNTGTASVTASGGTAPYTYSWNDASSQTTSAATGLAAGSYTCTITDTNACTEMVSIQVGTASNIGNVALESLSIYPNPSNGSFIVSFETLETLDLDIRIINTIGKSIYTNSFENVNGQFNKTINIDNISNGIYFLEISNEEAKTINRITIRK